MHAAASNGMRKPLYSSMCFNGQSPTEMNLLSGQNEGRIIPVYKWHYTPRV